MSKYFKILAFAIAIFASFASAYADDHSSRIAVVDGRKVMNETKLAIESKAKRNSDFESREKDMQEQGRLLQERSSQFENNAANLTPAKRIAEQKQMGELGREYERKRRVLSEDRNARGREDIAKIISLAKTVVKQIAVADGWDIVLQDVVYVNSNNDITEKVITMMNAAAP